MLLHWCKIRDWFGLGRAGGLWDRYILHSSMKILAPRYFQYPERRDFSSNGTISIKIRQILQRKTNLNTFIYMLIFYPSSQLGRIGPWMKCKAGKPTVWMHWQTYKVAYNSDQASPPTSKLAYLVFLVLQLFPARKTVWPESYIKSYVVPEC